MAGAVVRSPVSRRVAAVIGARGALFAGQVDPTVFGRVRHRPIRSRGREPGPLPRGLAAACRGGAVPTSPAQSGAGFSRANLPAECSLALESRGCRGRLGRSPVPAFSLASSRHIWQVWTRSWRPVLVVLQTPGAPGRAVVPFRPAMVAIDVGHALAAQRPNPALCRRGRVARPWSGQGSSPRCRPGSRLSWSGVPVAEGGVAQPRVSGLRITSGPMAMSGSSATMSSASSRARGGANQPMR